MVNGSARAATTAVHSRRVLRRLLLELGCMCWFLLAARRSGGGAATSLEPVGALPYWRGGSKGSRCLESRNCSIDQQCDASVLYRHLALTSSAPVGAVPSVDASVTTRPSCKESLMRHPPRSGLLVVGAAVALVGTAIAPVVTASGATPACTVDYSVTSQWDTGFQGAVKITN